MVILLILLMNNKVKKKTCTIKNPISNNIEKQTNKTSLVYLPITDMVLI